MGNFTNESGEVSVTNAAIADVLTAQEWCLLTMKLQGAALGNNHLLIGRGSVGMLIEAGDFTPPILIAPGQTVRVQTTSTLQVVWGYVVTPIPITMLMSALAHSMGYLNALACALTPPGTVEAVQDEIRKLLGS